MWASEDFQSFGLSLSFSELFLGEVIFEVILSLHPDPLSPTTGLPVSFSKTLSPENYSIYLSADWWFAFLHKIGSFEKARAKGIPYPLLEEGSDKIFSLGK